MGPRTKKSIFSADFSAKNRFSVVVEKIFGWKNLLQKNRKKIGKNRRFFGKNRQKSPIFRKKSAKIADFSEKIRYFPEKIRYFPEKIRFFQKKSDFSRYLCKLYFRSLREEILKNGANQSCRIKKKCTFGKNNSCLVH